MKSYGERLNRVTQEFTMFAAFAALEGRFRALNTNEGTDDDVDGIAYGFATAVWQFVAQDYSMFCQAADILLIKIV